MIRERLERDDRQMELMHGMMDRLGVDSIDAARDRNGAALMSAIRACCNCQSTPACAQWLNDVRTEGERPSFCPNMAFFLNHTAEKLPQE